MRLKNKILSLCLAGWIGLTSIAKADFKKEQGIVLGANVATSCLISGIGSKYHKRGFLKGCSKGLIAGTIMYGGKEIARYTEYDGVPFLGKIVHSAGVSMRDNVSLGNGMFDRYQIDFGPVLFSVNKEKDFDAYLLPGSAGNLVYNIAVRNKFDLEKTLSFGTPVFNFTESKFEERLTGINDLDGYTKANIIAFKDDYIMAHEFTHALQYREGTYLDQVIESDSLLGNLKYLKYIKLGSDANLVLFQIIPQFTMKHKDRPREFEAMEGYSK